jgi:hypothetical protein
MTFRISKYTYNSYKVPAMNKNGKFVTFSKIKVTFATVLVYCMFNVSLKFCVPMHKKLVNENVKIKENFEKRKLKQLSYDYMIFTQSRKDENSVNKLSLF